MKKVFWFFCISLLLFNLSHALTGAKYLIITNDMFSNIIRPLADWKTKKGVKAQVVTLSEIGSTPSQIRNYIYNAYFHSDIQPEYVLLVGSATRLPAVGNSDDYYADLTGTGNPLIELSIGRFPCLYPVQCSAMVAKTLRFDRTPYLADTTWYLKGTTIVDNDWDVDSIYWENSRYVHNFWRNHNYSHIDSFSTLAGDSSVDVLNAINNGRAFVTYRGLATANWWHFPFDPAWTTNNSKLPIVVSGTCATMSLSDTSYLGNRFLSVGNFANLKGAVGFFGTTIATSGNGLATLRGTVFKGFFRAVFQDNIYKLGDAAKRAKFILDSIRPFNYTDMRYKEWNLLGDPELSIYSKVPKPLTVILDTIILTGPQNYSVFVSQAGNPISNALVCLMMDSIIYQTAYTNSAGLASFVIYSPYAGTMSVTVTAQNSIPYEKNVSIVSGGNVHDISVVSITEPQSQITAGTLISPKVLIKNWGGYADTFSITLKIGNVYNNTISFAYLSPNDTASFTFPLWNSIIGNYLITAYITFDQDQWHANDTLRKTITVIVPNDVGVDAIVNPDSLQTLNKIFIPKAKIKNYGSLAQINFPVICSIFGNNRILRYVNTRILSLASGLDTVANFIPWTPTLLETCTVKVVTVLTNDENPANDVKNKSVAITQNYLENFEDGNGCFYAYPAINAWSWGKVNYGPYQSHSGWKCWSTGLNGNYTSNANWKLTSPELTADINNPILKFWHWYETDEYYDGGNVKISIDNGASWQLLYPETGYNGFVINVNPAIPNESCYSGTSDWTQAVFNLPVLAGQHFLIRFHFGSNNYYNLPGWYIDDITGIGISTTTQKSNDVAVDSIMYPLNNVALNVNQYPSALIKNWGILEQPNFPVVCSIVNSNGILRYTDTKFISLGVGQDTIINFSPWLPNATETCAIKICTQLANDENLTNDQKIRLTEVRWILFEAGFEETYFPPIGWNVYNNDSGAQIWVRGTISSHSGTASAESRYESSTLRNDDWLVTQSIYIPTNSAELRFWSRAHSAINYETLQVKISTITNAINDFNVTLQEYRFNNTAYSEFVVPINGYAGQNVYLAFVNKGLYARKIYLDDILIKGFTLGVNEPEIVNHSLKTMLYPIQPNPIVNNAVNINFTLAQATRIKLKIFDASGRQVKKLVNELIGSGVYNLNWNCRDDYGRKVAEGIYFISLEIPKQKFTKKLIITK